MENKEEYFKKEESILAEILKRGAQDYFESLPNLKSAFLLKRRVINCMDEGTPGGFRVAGSLILLPKEERKKFVKETQALGLFSHTDCGAVKIAYRETFHLRENEEPSLKELDSFAISEAKKIAREVKISYLGHLDASQLQRPLGFHIARAVYYLGIKCFEPERIKRLPRGFVVSRVLFSPSYAQMELETSLKLAFSKHGFGEPFFKKEPFLVIIISDQKRGALSPENLGEEAEKVLKKLPERIFKNCKIDSFILS